MQLGFHTSMETQRGCGRRSASQPNWPPWLAGDLTGCLIDQEFATPLGHTFFTGQRFHRKESKTTWPNWLPWRG